MSNREREIFTCALELAEERRAAFLDAVCASDTALRERLERLLRASDSAGPFLLDSDSELGERPGTLIGPYRLEARLGEGGFGIVWRAMQETPVRRLVALKIIKLGMDTRAIVARFAAERQALALMNHPNIARVFDAGATETGRPYFVMELVEGATITRYCREQRLSINARLQLFLQVCAAVQHAHQKGIVHRDLKPSNVLVTVGDGAPRVKVIDFGIAKATREPVEGDSLVSRLHVFLGTPAYMSPEQLRHGEGGVDTRADVYALGALLHELLTDAPPFDLQGLSGSLGFVEIERVVRETEAMPPSRRLAKVNLAVVAHERRTTPARFLATVRGDLDQIVLKCLEKDRDRRYGTVHALARDIERFLNQEPVVARAPTLAYRAEKFCRRHTRAVVATAIAGVAVIGFAWYHGHRLATERDRAREEANKARRVSELLTGVLTTADPFRSPGEGATSIPQMLANAAERARREFIGEPDVRADVLGAVGRVHLRTGRYAEAQPVLEAALAAAVETGQRDARRALILSDLGVLHREVGQFTRAVPLLEESLAIRRQLYPSGHNDVAITLVELGRVYRALEQVERAEPLLREALEIRQRVLGEHRETATSMSDVGLLWWFQGRAVEAEKMLTTCLAMTRRTLGDEHPNTAYAAANLALPLADRGEYVRAEELLHEAIAVLQRAFGERHGRPARIQVQLAGVWLAQGKAAEAATLLDEAMDVLRGRLGAIHGQTIVAVITRARTHLALNEPAAAAELLSRTLESQQRAGRPTTWRTGVMQSLLGEALLRHGRMQEAESLFVEAAAILPNVPGQRGVETTANEERLRTVRAHRSAAER